MKNHMTAPHQRFLQETEHRELREQIVEVKRDLRQTLNWRGKGRPLKLADLGNELQDEIPPGEFLLRI